MIKKKNHESLTTLRKRVFARKYKLDKEILGAVKGYGDNEFLLNPPIHNVYLYLVNLVYEVSKNQFGQKLATIKVLDWGAGKGHITYLLKKKGLNVTSCDIFHEEASDSSFGQNTPILSKFDLSVDPLNHDYKLPYADDSFDVLLSFGVLEHVKDDKKSMLEIGRVLKPGGLFFCFHLPQPFSWTQKVQHLRGNYYHDRFYSKESIQELSRSANLEVLDVWKRAFFPKNTINYPNNHLFEKLDLFLTEYTFLGHFATNIEFIAKKM